MSNQQGSNFQHPFLCSRQQAELWYQSVKDDAELGLRNKSLDYTTYYKILSDAERNFEHRINAISSRESYQSKVMRIRGYVDANDSLGAYLAANPFTYTTNGSIPSSSNIQQGTYHPIRKLGDVGSYPEKEKNTDNFNLKLDALEKVEAKKLTPRVPDFIEPIVAYRAWRVNPTSQKGQLIGVGVSIAWNAGSPMRAVGSGCTHGEGVAPVESCECGMWAFKTLENLKEAVVSYIGSSLCVGQVYMWGRIVECEFGYRAEYAYPKEIWCLSPEQEKLGAIYNVPIRRLEVSAAPAPKGNDDDQ